ncbi:MAG TPA: FliM/FliN family flagellar motor switch protein [Polyangia bacterium]|nr:FliM/FliN family flagellar motor switch protein [Polyangia bacterium]
MSARDAAAAQMATRLLVRLPRRAEATLAGFGTVVLRGAGVGAPAHAHAGDAIAFGLSDGRGAGRLALDAALAHRIVALALGGRARPPAVGRLGLGERGVVAGFVASVLHAVAAPFSVSLSTFGAAPVADGLVTFMVELEVTGVSGWASVEVPAAWLAGRGPDDARLFALPLVARLELSRTWLTVQELTELAVGDAVVFDGAAPFERPDEARAPSETRAVRITIGAHVADARLGRAGRVEIVREFRRVGATDAREQEHDHESDDKEIGMETTGRDPGTRASGEGATRVGATAVLAAAPVEVVAELGRTTLRGDEVAGLAPGSVLVFGRMGASAIALRVGDEIWAEGELVDVDGALGVRVTSLVRAGVSGR